MKKMTIITIYDLNNIGNRLQNYAVECLCKPYGVVSTKYIIKKASLVSKLLPNLLLHKLKILVSRNKNIKRQYAFLEFNKIFLSIKRIESKNIKNFNKLIGNNDYFITGSDQVWNPEFFEDMYINMLGFASPEKRIALAPSISVDSLTNEQEKEFLKYLPSFKALSCREEQGSEIIRKLTGREVTTLIDPTLMLTCDEWDKIAKKPKFHNANKKYLLLYFLGNITSEYQEYIEKYAKNSNLEIINILDKNSKYYFCGPSEFIYLIKNAHAVFTDSFHGTVFSLLYEKKLKIFNRIDDLSSMNSRLINIKNLLQISDETFYNKKDNLEIYPVKYSKEKLEIQRKIFNNYLKNALKE